MLNCMCKFGVDRPVFFFIVVWSCATTKTQKLFWLFSMFYFCHHMTKFDIEVGLVLNNIRVQMFTFY